MLGRRKSFSSSGSSSKSAVSLEIKLKELHKLVRTSNPLYGNNYCALIASANRFDLFILTTITIYSGWIGFEIDYNKWYQARGTAPNATMFFIGDTIFTIIFVLEICCRFFAYKKKQDFWRDPQLWVWNIFDLCLIILMIFETWIMLLLNDIDVPSLSILRMLRLLRISRLFRMIPELALMIKSMVAALKSVSSTLLLAVAIMYVFSIILTEWFLNSDMVNQPCNPVEFDDGLEDVCFEIYFGNIEYSLLTMIQLLIFDDTFNLIRPAMRANKMMGVILIIFIFLAAFLVLNMLIGVICEIVASTTSREKDQILQQRVKEVFGLLDTDDNGYLDREEFAAQQTTEFIGMLGLSKQVVEDAFDLIDSDQSGTLELQEFVDIVFKLMHPPDSIDLLRASCKIDLMLKHFGLSSKQQIGYRSSVNVPPYQKTPPISSNNNHTGVVVANSKLAVLNENSLLAHENVPHEGQIQPLSSSGPSIYSDSTNCDADLNDTAGPAPGWSVASHVSAEMSKLRRSFNAMQSVVKTQASTIKEMDTMLVSQRQMMKDMNCVLEEQLLQLTNVPDDLNKVMRTLDSQGNAVSLILNEITKMSHDQVLS